MRYYKTTTEYNCGIDLHSRQMYICLMDKEADIKVWCNIKGNPRHRRPEYGEAVWTCGL